MSFFPATSDEERRFIQYAEHLDDPTRSQVHWACEKPAIRDAIGTVRGLRIVDFGCGVGDLASLLLSAGAEEVVGVDVAPAALVVAQRRNPGPTYVPTTSQSLDAIERQMDLVVSSLVMHYIEDWAPVLERFRFWLPTGGRLVMSILHPFETALERSGDSASRFLYGRSPGKSGTRLLGEYQVSGQKPRAVAMDLDGVSTTIFHHGFSTIVEALHRADLRIVKLIEPGPDPTLELIDPQRHSQWQRQPKVLVISAVAS